jgi:C4-dicarboxylate-specific signal transduction histidine kinase
MINDVEEGITRVKEIVSTMRDFSYGANTRLEQVDVAPVVGTALHLLSHEWKAKVQVEQQLDPEHVIWGNRNRIVQVLLNILQNSLDALATKPFTDGERPIILISSRADAGRVLIIVRDNGGGINKDHLDKIFDPFFTTKEVGQGMGLGLSICYRIVRDYGGRIHVRTEPGSFCEFTLDFPAERPLEEIAAPPSPGEQHAGPV